MLRCSFLSRLAIIPLGLRFVLFSSNVRPVLRGSPATETDSVFTLSSSAAPPLSMRLRESVFVCVLGHRGRVLGESKAAGEMELACTCVLSAFMTKILLFVDRTSHGTLEVKALFGGGFVEDALVEFLAQRD